MWIVLNQVSVELESETDDRVKLGRMAAVRNLSLNKWRQSRWKQRSNLPVYSGSAEDFEESKYNDRNMYRCDQIDSTIMYTMRRYLEECSHRMKIRQRGVSISQFDGSDTQRPLNFNWTWWKKRESTLNDIKGITKNRTIPDIAAHIVRVFQLLFTGDHLRSHPVGRSNRSISTIL